MNTPVFTQLGLWADTADTGPGQRPGPDRVGGGGLGVLARFLSTHSDVVARYRARIWGPVAHECQFWLGALNGRTGHAKVHLGYVRGRQWVEYGHRIAWVLAGGPLLGAGACIRHTCDEASCQQPQHLIEGSSAENSHDWAMRRGDVRGPLGDARGAYGRAKAIQDAIVRTADQPREDQLQAVARARAIGIAADQLMLLDPPATARGQGINPQVTAGQGGLF